MALTFFRPLIDTQGHAQRHYLIPMMLRPSFPHFCHLETPTVAMMTFAVSAQLSRGVYLHTMGTIEKIVWFARNQANGYC
jgi:hypothetical protein